jgi:zinc/manganese transport system substrate-binding protein
VTVIIPNGVDPHDFRPSAQDRAAVDAADLVVTNGLGLESSLGDALDDARAEGTAVFVAGDHIDVRTFTGGEHDDGGPDPHFWVDPVAMKQVVGALADTLAAMPELGLQEVVGERRDDVEAGLDAVDRSVADTLAPIPAERRVMVTGHESLGYFADRYDFTIVGAVIPSTTSQAAASSGELADLTAQIERYRVPVIFTELGTPASVADAVADETGARVVELATHTMPPDGSYASFMATLAGGIAEGLDPS